MAKGLSTQEEVTEQLAAFFRSKDQAYGDVYENPDWSQELARDTWKFFEKNLLIDWNRVDPSSEE